MRALTVTIGALGALALGAPASGATLPQTRYSLAGGCYQVRSTVSGQPLAAADGPFRLQAAALGQYLLYGVHGDYLADGGRGVVAPAPAPGRGAQWELDGSARSGFTIANLATARALPVSFTPAAGCAVYPEAELNANGSPFRGASPMGLVNGTIDAHTHVTGFELFGGAWHCGRPWHAFGIPYALPDCASVQQGTNGQVESFLDYGSPGHKHDTVGWPTFRDWPSPTDLAEEGAYYTGIKRAWSAGLRVMVTQLVENEGLCLLMSTRSNPCNDMSSVRIQARDLRALQDYVDAQSGGPGRGFFRIVTDPFQARRVINQGKLAVVEGIEVSHLFDCGERFGVPECDRAQIDAGLKEVRALGVSTFFPVHKFDNAFGGTKMDGGETGLLVNVGNHLETGSFWNVETCRGPEHDSAQLTLAPIGGLAALLNGPAASLLQGAALPVYPAPPSCNTRGLTPLGAYLINRMIQQHFVIELDHMDAKTADAALALIEAHKYSGVVSAHTWDSPEENPRIYNVGGFVTPIAGASPRAFVDQWRASRRIRNPRFYSGSGFGYGADINGLAEQSQPATSGGFPISYPFKSYDGGVSFNRERWGQRVFDLNTDGVANYGMYPDWLAELQGIAGRPILTDMFHGAEAYLQTWERASGVAATSCLPAQPRIDAFALGPLDIADSPVGLLFSAGQPSSRVGRSFRYCVSGRGNQRSFDSAVFGPDEKADLVASTARGATAGGVAVGAPVTTPGHHATSLGRGVWLGPPLTRGRRYVYGVRSGRVRFVALATSARARDRVTLMRGLAGAGLR